MKAHSYVSGAIALLAIAYEVHSAAAPANVHDLMKDVVAVQAQVVWDVSNQAQDDAGNPDASKLAAGDWTKIMAAGEKVRQAAQALAQSEHVLAAAPGVKLEGEGNPGAFGAQQVQAAIDANPAQFRAYSKALAVSMEQLASATKTKDATKLADVSGALDQVCETCHVKFWYPQQQAAR
ncbi:MAG TPA: cytochrome c [Steroidobacteraceae bacterium]|nr:cytochrome c [Steroidobacteraceae bacterium]